MIDPVVIFGLDNQAWSDIWMVSGYLALLVFTIWPSQKHCSCCAKRNPVNRRHK